MCTTSRVLRLTKAFTFHRFHGGTNNVSPIHSLISLGKSRRLGRYRRLKYQYHHAVIFPSDLPVPDRDRRSFGTINPDILKIYMS